MSRLSAIKFANASVRNGCMFSQLAASTCHSVARQVQAMLKKIGLILGRLLEWRVYNDSPDAHFIWNCDNKRSIAC